mmetsp:Transcript_513/g.1205  ORF Transcript_513/g.1205 Transcript_513/m.1205 type:complete len:127 (+) Transcript_513:1662-2042(+)
MSRARWGRQLAGSVSRPRGHAAGHQAVRRRQIPGNAWGSDGALGVQAHLPGRVRAPQAAVGGQERAALQVHHQAERAGEDPPLTRLSGCQDTCEHVLVSYCIAMRRSGGYGRAFSRANNGSGATLW